MLICKVVKPLVSTNRIPGFEHKHLQVVLDGSSNKVAVDAVGSREGNLVFTASGSAARFACPNPEVQTDLTIGGIIDYWESD